MLLKYENIGKWLSANIKISESAIIATAFFSPNNEMIEELKSIKNVEIFISDNYIINDPNKIESIINTSTIKIKEIPFEDKKKFHAKVIKLSLKNGSFSLMIGSANYTNSGLNSNDEAVIVFDDLKKGDPILRQVDEWIIYIKKRSKNIDIEEAKNTYNSYKHRFPHYKTKDKETKTNCWVIKTTEGSEGKNHWKDFIRENVIAIGWPNLYFENSLVNDRIDGTRLRAEIEKSYPKTERQKDYVINTFRSFYSAMKKGDYVIISRGYVKDQSPKISLYGICKIKEDEMKIERSSEWWKFKRPVELQIIEELLPYELYAKSFGKESMRQTIHNITKDQFNNFVDNLEGEYGIVLTI